MKTRSGFVSNSSSSSFVVIASKETIKKAEASLSELGKLMVRHELGWETIQLDGKTYQLTWGENNTEDFGGRAIDAYCDQKEIDTESDRAYELSEEVQEQWTEFLEAVNNNGGVAKDQC